MKPRQDSNYFTDDISESIFLNENLCILIQMSLTFIRQCSIEKIHSWLR